MTTAHDLSARLADLLRHERHALAEFLVALAEFDRERVWVELGHASLFSYLHRDLGLSKGASFYRMTAARLIQQHPDVVTPLRDGRLCLTSVVELSKVLTPENRSEVLPRFFQLSKREAKAVTAELRPAEAVPRREVVTALRPARPAELPMLLAAAPTAAPERDGEGQPGPDLGQAAVHPANHTMSEARADRGGRVVEDPLTADESRLHLTVSRRFLTKLEAARDALSHSHPGASRDEILEAGLDILLERAAKRRGIVSKPRNAPRPTKTDRIPAHVRRAVWERDAGRCQLPLASGGICGSTCRVQLDHIRPLAQGGGSTVENLRCACDIHNVRAAREAYGDAVMDRYTRKGRAGDRCDGS